MRTYKEYRKISLAEHKRWERTNTDYWWHSRWDADDIKGEYPMLTVKRKDRNNAPIISNVTNADNLSLCTLFDVLAMALIDWCNENGMNSIYSYSFKLMREVRHGEDVFIITHKAKDNDRTLIEDPWFDDCDAALCDIVADFLSIYWRDLPTDWNRLSFSLDCVDISCKHGEWVCDSDGAMSIYNMNSMTHDYVSYVSCM